MPEPQESIQCTNNLLNYFRRELKFAFDRVGLHSSENTEAYLVYLLESFVRLDPQLNQNVGFHKAAALLLGEAMNSPGDLQIEAYRRLGDASLFNCGFFDAYLTRRGAVTSRYYRNVGRIAYGHLNDLMRLKQSGGVFEQIYAELAQQFDAFVEAFKWLGMPPAKPQHRIGRGETVAQRTPLGKLRCGESPDLEDLKRAGLVPANTPKKS